MTSFYPLVKRITDIVIAVAILIALSPLFAVIAACIYWQMGLPIIFRQTRAGRFGRPFIMYKFRTMKDDLFDDRNMDVSLTGLTPLGRRLRRFSLDELPQILNVLKGDMSLVGPRPLFIPYNELYNDHQRRRLGAMPGITGFSQIRGRNAISWEERFNLDVWYVDHRDWFLDLRILLETAYCVLSGNGLNQNAETSMDVFRGTKK